jgi:hypothetical protein
MKIQSIAISLLLPLASLLMQTVVVAQQPLALKLTAELQPADRQVRVRYAVPDAAPDSVIAKCMYRLKGQNDWQIARVMKLRSRTALTAIHDDEVLGEELSTGEMTEALAAGQTRSAIWQTFPQLANGKKHEATVRIELFDDKKILLASGMTDVVVDLSDVVLLDESMIYRRQPLYDKAGDKPGWVWRTDVPGLPGALDVVEGPRPLEPLAFRPNLRGFYAIYVAVPHDPSSEIELRLSGDSFCQRFPGLKEREYFWRIARMDGENVVASQAWRTISTPAEINNDFRSRWKYVRLVPIAPELQKKLAGIEGTAKRDKLVFGFFEPYSWTFTEYVDRNSGWLEPFAAFAEAKIDAVDIQYGRIGAKPYYESLVEQPLLQDTIGDPSPGGEGPVSSDVGRLPLFCQGVPAAVRAGKAFGVDVIANLGAGNAYPGTALQSEFAKSHPQFIKDTSWPQYKHKEVRDYCLSLYRELLDAGARRISIDFCRYQHTVDDPKLPTLLLSEMRKLADQYSREGDRVKIIVRFPIPGSGGENGNFIPQDWIKAGSVDYIVPSSVFGNALYFDSTPYLKMTRGTSVKCLPCIEAGYSGALWPGQMLQQAVKFYDEGADGVYIYQSDARIVGAMTSSSMFGLRKFVPALGSVKATRETLKQVESEADECSTDIYMYFPDPYSTTRVQVWIEGGKPEAVQYFIGGKEVVGRKQPPYEIGQEGHANDYAITEPNAVTFEVRAKIRGKWLSRQKQYKVFNGGNN